MLGGLLEDRLLETNQRVPILGSIPLLGALFRSQSTDSSKTNLMVFIRTKILRDSVQTAFETDAKYNAIRDVQQQGGNYGYLRSKTRPVLPPLETYKPADADDSGTEPESDE